MKRITILFFVAALLAMILACAEGEPQPTPLPLPRVYETANTRIDQLQATAQTLMTEEPR